MNVPQLIARKRDGHALHPDEIAAVVSGFVDGSIPDYQLAALAMAIYFQGMDGDETVALTDQMLRSGGLLEWSADGPPKVDKHSTGGIGDKVSLVLAPLLACCDLHVPMISGRGLGPTGGTLDKLESIPGFRTDLNLREIRSITERVGCVITGATGDLVPADQKLYALRDVTATVPSIPLITASILSKKLAENLDALVLDVKFGSGAFMKSTAAARELATSLTHVGTQLGLSVSALLCDMNQPLGRTAGNAVEVRESLETLDGDGPADLVEVILALGAELLQSMGAASDLDAARTVLRGHLDSGRARERFDSMVVAQGGDPAAPLTVAQELVIEAGRPGYIGTIDTEALGHAIVDLGGGRRQRGDVIDHSTGIKMLVRIGDRVDEHQPLVRVYADQVAAHVTAAIQAAVVIAGVAPAATPLILERVGN